VWNSGRNGQSRAVPEQCSVWNLGEDRGTDRTEGPAPECFFFFFWSVVASKTRRCRGECERDAAFRSLGVKKIYLGHLMYPWAAAWVKM